MFFMFSLAVRSYLYTGGGGGGGGRSSNSKIKSNELASVLPIFWALYKIDQSETAGTKCLSVAGPGLHSGVLLLLLLVLLCTWKKKGVDGTDCVTAKLME